MKKIIGLITIANMLSADVNHPVEFSANLPKIVVKGESKLKKPADMMTLSVGVVTQGTSADGALKENNQIMNAVTRALEKEGLNKDEYQTGRFSVQPIWSRPPKNPDNEWQSTIVGYLVANSVNVRTESLDKVGDIIDAAGKAGANSIDNIQFTLKDDRVYREESIRLASMNAMGDAKVIAQATGQKLGRLLEASLDNAAQVPEFHGMRAMSFGKMGGSGDNLPLNPGDVEVFSSVLLIYEIAPQ